MASTWKKARLNDARVRLVSVRPHASRRDRVSRAHHKSVHLHSLGSATPRHTTACDRRTATGASMVRRARAARHRAPPSTRETEACRIMTQPHRPRRRTTTRVVTIRQPHAPAHATSRGHKRRRARMCADGDTPGHRRAETPASRGPESSARNVPHRIATPSRPSPQRRSSRQTTRRRRSLRCP